MKVTKEHVESLQNTINNVRKWIAEGEVVVADKTLEMLSDSLGKTIEKEERKTQALKKGDLVRIVDICEDGHEQGIQKYLGVEAFVTGVDEQWDYPYTLQAVENSIEGLEDYLWRAEDLHII